MINNDCWAYLWGVLLGKRFVKKPFFRLSPKKTWEGFLGAAVSTVIVAYPGRAEILPVYAVNRQRPSRGPDASSPPPQK